MQMWRGAMLTGVVIGVGLVDGAAAWSDWATLTGTVAHDKPAVVLLEEAGRERFGMKRRIKESIQKAEPTDGPLVELDHVELVFTPHVLAIEQGTVVEFVNSDDLLHNIHLYRGTDMETMLNIGMPLKDMRIGYRFDVPGEVVVLCDVHSNAHFAMTDVDGQVEITGVAPGDYALTTWREGEKIETRKIQISDGANTF